MTRRGPEFVVRTRDEVGRLDDHRVDWVIGGKRMQDPVTVLPDGRWQVLPVYYHVTGRGEWVDYNESKQGAVTPSHPFFWTNFRRTANRECLDCHSTGLDVTYAPSNHTWTTGFVDAGVACENCHGPGERHAVSKKKEDIVHPRDIDPELGLAICGACHGPRNPLFPILDAAHRFKPGQRYEDYYQAFVITDGQQTSKDFFADGRPSSSSYEYQALVQSQCHRKGGATCLSCHTAPHAEDKAPNDIQPAPKDSANESCRSCHEGILDARKAHSHHRSPAAQSCVACHMPDLVKGVLDTFADHALDVPVPENTTRHGVPNACQTCHADQSSEAMALAIRSWWPKAAARQQRRLRLADAIDPATARASRSALEGVVGDREEAPTLRGAAALLLAQRFGPSVGVSLRTLLSDPSAVVRTQAAGALALSRAPASADGLFGLSRDSSLSVRQSAALTLAALNDPRAASALHALADDPASSGLVQPHVHLGLLAGRAGNFTEAARQFEEALRLQPYNATPLLALADIDARQGNWDSARSRLLEVLRFDPQSTSARNGLQVVEARGRR